MDFLNAKTILIEEQLWDFSTRIAGRNKDVLFFTMELFQKWTLLEFEPSDYDVAAL